MPYKSHKLYVISKTLNYGQYCTILRKSQQPHNYNHGIDPIIQLNGKESVRKFHKLFVRMKHLHQHSRLEFPPIMVRLLLKFPFYQIDNYDPLLVAIPVY